MKTNPFIIAARSKGPAALYRRALSIAQRYGLTSFQMDQALRQFTDVLQHFGCGATLPITAVTLKRHCRTISKYLSQNIEFAVHGYTHIDYSHLTPEEQSHHLKLARQVFSQVGIDPVGFRSPYLSRSDELYTAIKSSGFTYESNQPILWESTITDALHPSEKNGYERALAFYQPWRASERPSLPWLNDSLVQIPISLPDDEMLIERLAGANDIVNKTWMSILSQTYQRGELFTLQLHPERIERCAEGLTEVLSEARGLTPKVWCARLDEIAAWWRARSNATIDVIRTDHGAYQCRVDGPKDATILARSIEVDVPCSPWANGYREVKEKYFTANSSLRPLIGISPTTPKSLALFLQQQGYFVEISSQGEDYSRFFDQANFDSSQELTIMNSIEGSCRPLIRLGRWPNSAQSALAVTGDIDALTIWDYALRLMGK